MEDVLFTFFIYLSVKKTNFITNKMQNIFIQKVKILAP